MTAKNTERNERIRSLASEGKSFKQIAAATGLTESTVAGILKDRTGDNEKKRQQRAERKAAKAGGEPVASVVVPAPVAEATEGKQRTTASIDQIRIGQRHRKDFGDLDALAASIAAVGLLQPLVLTPDGQLLAGERRLRAVTKLGWAEVPIRIVEGLGDARLALLAERDENTCRKDFAPSEAVSIGKALEELEAPKAKHRRAAKLKKGATVPVVENCHNGEQSTGKTRDKVAEAVGMSGRTYAKAKAVMAAAAKEPERFAEVVEAMDATGKVDPAFQEMKKRQDAAVRSEDQPPTTPERQANGVGVIRAQEAINCLKRIPPHDPLRKRGFQIVADWVKKNA